MGNMENEKNITLTSTRLDAIRLLQGKRLFVVSKAKDKLVDIVTVYLHEISLGNLTSEMYNAGQMSSFNNRIRAEYPQLPSKGHHRLYGSARQLLFPDVPTNKPQPRTRARKLKNIMASHLKYLEQRLSQAIHLEDEQKAILNPYTQQKREARRDLDRYKKLCKTA